MKKHFFSRIIPAFFNSSVLFFICGQAFSLAYAESGGSSDDVFAELFGIANILAGLGVLLCGVKLAQIGFKFMFKSANKRSDAIQSLYPWGLGCLICALWFPIGQWVMSLFGVNVDESGHVDTGPWGGPFDI